jgi:hypothetical protein
MPNKKKRTARKKSVASKTVKKKATRIKTASKSPARKKKFSAKRKRVTSTGVVAEAVSLSSVERRERRDGQSGDLQGLSSPPTANSESVEELLEEGNAFEAEAVEGVERALDADQGEVETHEVPEDDVPQEYLDRDR